MTILWGSFSIFHGSGLMTSKLRTCCRTLCIPSSQHTIFFFPQKPKCLQKLRVYTWVSSYWEIMSWLQKIFWLRSVPQTLRKKSHRLPGACILLQEEKREGKEKKPNNRKDLLVFLVLETRNDFYSLPEPATINFRQNLHFLVTLSFYLNQRNFTLRSVSNVKKPPENIFLHIVYMKDKVF